MGMDLCVYFLDNAIEYNGRQNRTVRVTLKETLTYFDFFAFAVGKFNISGAQFFIK